MGIIDTYCKTDALDILDAGCGKGWLSDQLSSLGHRVVGIDTSKSSIDICRKQRAGTYHQSSLSEYSSSYFFDVVVSMDVMFHILDESDWENSVINLASLVRHGGLLLLVDDPRDETYTLGDYIIHRSISHYIEILSRVDYKLLETVPYRFAANPNQFLVFSRAGN